MHTIEKFLAEPGLLMCLLDTMSEGIVVVDDKGEIRYLNRSVEEMVGYTLGEMVGKPYDMLYSENCVPLNEPGKRKKCNLLEVTPSQRKKCMLRSKDGKAVHVLKNTAILKNGNGTLTGVEILTDITLLYLKERELEAMKHELNFENGFMGLVGKSPAILELYERIRNAALSDAPVIICGESGTGKELVAHAIHKLSRRKGEAFVKVNCAALNESLLESELFGHVRGAFTGAIRERVGRFEAADKGSIFLDEIGDMPGSMQAKLLRVLQEKEVERVGDNRPIHVDVRLITATNKDVCGLMDLGQFREDLYYRINVIPIHTPPLRERREDIPELVSYFLKKTAHAHHKEKKEISSEALDILRSYPWPGNVRQLINVIEYASATSKNKTVTVADLPGYIYQKKPAALQAEGVAEERKKIISALTAHKWNRAHTAKYLGISRVTLWSRMKELNIRPDRDKEQDLDG